MNFGKMSKFQLFFLAALIVAVLFAIGFFALNKAAGGVTTSVTIWGTIADLPMQQFLQRPDINSALSDKKVAVKYVAKPEATFDQDLVNAIASGRGPDAVIITQDAVAQYLDKIIPIPYASFSEAKFKSMYVQEAELFLTANGEAAMPFTIDPMVMYWNRTLFTNAGLAKPPVTWTQLYGSNGAIAKINNIDVNHNIVKTALSLGTYSNVNHAKDILALLMLQGGTPIISKNQGGAFQSVITTAPRSSEKGNAGLAALSFYTQFADPAKENIYSWNSALPNSRDAFVSGDLALYFGYSSELKDLYTRNSNLNFDIAPVPQSPNSLAKITFGKVYGITILKNSQNASATANAIVTLAGSASQAAWSAVSGFPPITRDLLATPPADPSRPFEPVFYTAALQSQGWLDPDRGATSKIFSEMVGSVISGDKRADSAVQEADAKLGVLLNTLSN